MNKIIRLLAVTAMLSLSSVSFAQINLPGTLDSTFGVNGKVMMAFSSNACMARAVAVQSDGKILVAGETYNGTSNQFAVARYLSNGTLDSQFGTGGKTTISFGSGNSVARSIAVQPNGFIVVSGSYQTPSQTYFAVARLNNNGMPDALFGSSGKVQTSIVPGFNTAYAMAIQPNDGKIILAGVSFDTLNNGDFALVRYNPNGTIDPYFANGGKVRTSLGTTWDQINTIAIMPGSGKIVVGGRTSNAYALARYDSSGFLDNSFGFNGISTYTLFSQSEIINSLYIDNQQRIMVCGSTLIGGNMDAVFMRYLSDGNLDNTFGSNGISSFDLGGIEVISAIAPQDEFIVGAGTASSGGTSVFLALRMDTTGVLDGLYNAAGFNLISFPGSSGANALAVQPWDSYLVATGFYTFGTVNNFATARFTSNFTFTGVSDIEQTSSSIQIFPNPATSIVRIQSEAGFDKFTICDLTGKIVYESALSERMRSISFDSRQLHKGIYLVSTQRDGVISASQKFIVAD
ncbi:MAG: T9SS type A sorting domain-containing protein [Bacteroidetes bacterium]|jgi:uncharacterized delta-60 repeat protein|nr:T9SS type A sorting domain-containing protein [Bacteroidota bacterium]